MYFYHAHNDFMEFTCEICTFFLHVLVSSDNFVMSPFESLREMSLLKYIYLTSIRMDKLNRKKLSVLLKIDCVILERK